MRVFIAGASGAVGTRLVPQLVERGHEVVGTHHSPGKDEGLRALGAEPVALDLLDREAVLAAVRAARPDAVVHEATALANQTFCPDPASANHDPIPVRAPWNANVTSFSTAPAGARCSRKMYFIPIMPASSTGGASSFDAIVTTEGASIPISQPTPRWYRCPMAAANGEPAPCPR